MHYISARTPTHTSISIVSNLCSLTVLILLKRVPQCLLMWTTKTPGKVLQLDAEASAAWGRPLHRLWSDRFKSSLDGGLLHHCVIIDREDRSPGIDKFVWLCQDLFIVSIESICVYVCVCVCMCVACMWLSARSKGHWGVTGERLGKAVAE